MAPSGTGYHIGLPGTGIDRTEREMRVRPFIPNRPAALASLLKIGRNTKAEPPPPSFVRDRIAENGFEVQYRFPPDGDDFDWTAPPHEGTLTVYPFDPAGAATREEAGVPAGSGTVIEIFAYNDGRERHRVHWQRVADARGWTLYDPND